MEDSEYLDLLISHPIVQYIVLMDDELSCHWQHTSPSEKWKVLKASYHEDSISSKLFCNKSIIRGYVLEDRLEIFRYLSGPFSVHISGG